MGRLDHFGFWRQALEQPTKLAIAFGDGSGTTYGGMARLVRTYRSEFRQLGLVAGDTVAVMLENGPDYIAAFFASVEEGFYFTPINYHLLADEVAYIVRDSGAKAFVTSATFASIATPAAEQAELAASARLAIDDMEGFRRPRELDGDAELIDPPDDGPIGAVMIYTSGTTGRPKGVRRPLPNVSNFAPTQEMNQIILGNPTATGPHLVCGPFYHLGPFTPAVTALHHGCTVILSGRWTPEVFLALVEQHRVESTFMVPTHFHRLIRTPVADRERYDHSSLRHVLHSAAPCSIELKRAMIDWVGPILHESYAATEAGGTYVTSDDWLAHPGTVGRVWTGASLFIVDDNGTLCPPGTPGHIVFESSTNRFEYLNDPAKTATVRELNRVKVGDIGFVDEAGYLYLSGRRSDMIISGGVNIYPAEVEARLLEHPAVRDAAVLGVPNEEWGESVRALVQVFDDVVASPQLGDELIEYCRMHLAAYKCPKSVEFRASLPRTDAGKLYKRHIKPTPD